MCVSVSDFRTHAHTVGRPAIRRTLSGDGGLSQKAVPHGGPLHSLVSYCVFLTVCVCGRVFSFRVCGCCSSQPLEVVEAL